MLVKPMKRWPVGAICYRIVLPQEILALVVDLFTKLKASHAHFDGLVG